jgi:hypothetical protein
MNQLRSYLNTLLLAEQASFVRRRSSTIGYTPAPCRG